MEYLLAHDVGTSGCKAALVSVDGQVVATAYQTYPTSFPQPLYAEQDVGSWWHAVVQTTRRVLEESDTPREAILALSFSTQMLNTIPVDKDGQPLRPCISWLDGRAWDEARQVMRKLGGAKIFSLVVGASLTGKDLLPKYLWLKHHEPAIYASAAAFLDCSSYLLHRTTGKLVYEWSTASVTGLFNLKTKSWDTTLIRLFGLDPAKFPPLVRSIDKVGGLLPGPANELGLLEGTPVFGGAGDAQCTAVGSGATDDGNAHITLGTSGYVGVTTRRKVTGRRGVATIQAADPEALLLIAESETVGACLKWAAREIYGLEPGERAYAQMDRDVEGEQPGSGNLIFTPWMYGERCPIPDESVRAAFINLGSNHTRAQMARAVYEGVAYNFRWIIDTIHDLYGFECNPIRAVGGGARGLPWLRIIADVTGRSIERTAHDQGAAAMGAALVAAVGLGICDSFTSVRALLPPTSIYHPNPSDEKIYTPLYTAFKQIYPSLREIYHKMNREVI